MAVITGTAGDDTITTLVVSAGVVGGKATAGADSIAGGGGADSIDGGNGNDTIEGGAGADTLEGWLGNNTLSYASDTVGVIVDLSGNIVSGVAAGSHATGDVISNFQNFIGGSGGDVVKDRLHENNAFNMGGGDDVVFVRDGNDTINGGANSTLPGGGDILSYQADIFHTAGVTVSLAITTAQNTAGTDFQVITGFENLFGSNFDDRLTGSTGDNGIDGKDGNDTIKGGAGHDTLDGGAGLTGGYADIVSYAGSSAAVTVDLGAQTVSGGDATGDQIVNFEGAIGTALGDVLIGGLANAILIGGAGADTLTGGSNTGDAASYETSAVGVTVDLKLATKQVSAGDAAADVLSGIEWITGSKFADKLTGGIGFNKIFAGAGDDTVDGGADGDWLDGGTGNNTLTYANSSAGVTMNFNTGGGGAGGDAQGDTIDVDTFRSLVGSAFDDTLTGDGRANVIVAGLGNDTVDGISGNDTLDGGAGIDTLSFASSVLAVNVNLATVGPQAMGALGTLTLSGFENVDGSDVGDTLAGSAAANVLDGMGGADLLRGAGGADKLLGGLGDDTLLGGAGADTLDGGTGGETEGDWASFADATAAVTVHLDTGSAVSGGVTDSLISIANVIGSAFADTIVGDGSANILMGGAGNDTLDGNGGADIVSYANAVAGVVFDLTKQGGTVQATGGGGSDRINGSSFIGVTGGAGNDKLIGSAADNIIKGGGGNDTLEGGGGADTLDGGAGANTLSYVNDGGGLIVDLPTTFVQHGAIVDQIANFRNVLGGAGDDGINGDAAGNLIDGGGGNDDIFGGNGGNDTLKGGANGAIGDTLDFLNAGSKVTFNLAILTAQTIGAGSVTASGFENVTGSSFADALRGDGGKNYIDGGAGDDTIEGGVGADTLDGGANNDTVSYAHSAHGVFVDLLAGTQVALTAGVVDDAAGDVLVNFENIVGTNFADHLSGSGGDNVIVCGLGNDTLQGSSGDDTVSFAGVGVAVSFFFSQLGGSWNTGAGTKTISGFNRVIGGNAGDKLVGEINDDWMTGGLGADTLSGGTAGSDKFVYRTLAEKGDHILDFHSGEDFLMIDHAGFKNTVANDTHLAQGATPVAGDNAHAWFLYDTDDGKLYFDDDGTGAHARVLLLTLDNKPASLSSADIIIQ